MPCRTYTTSQTVDFIGLIFDQAQVKNAAAKTGITLSTAYRYQKMWNETHKVPEKKKRGRVKSKVLTEEHMLFTVKPADSFVPMTLEHMREKLIEEHPAFSISKTQFYRHVKEQYALSIKKLEKLTEHRNSDETLAKKKNHLITKWILRRATLTLHKLYVKCLKSQCSPYSIF